MEIKEDEACKFVQLQTEMVQTFLESLQDRSLLSTEIDHSAEDSLVVQQVLRGWARLNS